VSLNKASAYPPGRTADAKREFELTRTLREVNEPQLETGY